MLTDFSLEIQSFVPQEHHVSVWYACFLHPCMNSSEERSATLRLFLNRKDT